MFTPWVAIIQGVFVCYKRRIRKAITYLERNVKEQIRNQYT